MAINSRIELFSRDTPSTSICSSNNKEKSTKRLMRTEFSYNGAAVSSKHMKIKKCWDSKSPYLTPDVMQKTNKKSSHFVSSYPLAINLYKANSDEFKTMSKINNRKVKKSVLTLPNDSVALLPQTCTVSDMNDSSYFDREENKVKKNTKKRLPVQKKKKSRNSNKKFEFYDRDARYCSQMNINFDCSSTHLMNNFNGDGNKISLSRTVKNSDQSNPSDVWAMLKNINRFQFRPSPSISESSFKPKKKRTFKKKPVNQRDRTYYETCETEEFAFISSYEVKKNPSVSQSSSADRITIVDKLGGLNSLHDSEIILFDNPLLTTSDSTVQQPDQTIQPKRYLRDLSKNLKPTKPRNKNNHGHTHVKTDVCCKDTNQNNPFMDQTMKLKPVLDKERYLKLTIEDSSQNNKDTTKTFLNTRLSKDISDQNKTLKPLSCLMPTTGFPKVTETEVRKRNSSAIAQNINNVKIISNDTKFHKQNKKEDKKIINKSTISNRDNKPIKLDSVMLEKRRVADNIDIKKPTPILHFKDKMLQLLYKKSSKNAITTKSTIDKDSKDVDTEKVKAVCNKDASTETYIHLATFCDDDYTRCLSPAVHVSFSPEIKKPPLFKYPWSKAKRASDFIDGVIRKIKSGVYYNQEFKDFIHRCDQTKEVSIQTSLTLSQYIIPPTSIIDDQDHDNEINDSSLALTQNSPALPGFNNAMAAVEIKTLDTSQITIKHCVTNIILQFDVMVPNKSDPMFLEANTSFSLIPLAPSESESKIYKCKTTIINDQLPAEICSILPQMMCNFKNMQAFNTVPPYQCDKKESLLSVIPEVACVESYTYNPRSILQLKSNPLTQGNFSRHVNITKCVMPEILCNRKSVKKNSDLTSTLLPQIIKKEFTIIINPHLLVPFIRRNSIGDHKNLCIKSNTHDIVLRRNMALQPYYKKQQMNVFQDYNAMYILYKMFNYHRFNLNFTTPTYNLNFIGDEKAITLTMMFEKSNCQKEFISVAIDKQKMKSLFINELHTNNNNDNDKSIRSIDNKRYSNKTKVKKEGCYNIAASKTRKRKFIKLYKKCKSTSYISSEKTSTPLSKIFNMEDFFQALGSGKTLSSVCEGLIGNRILSCLDEMKNWMTEISPRQALLVLLLNNKKETQNLRRYRPILLQGIAVNRITRAAELDMEIEVIEREKLNTLTEYEGISYLPSSPENQDNLLEELYWIAKTTASDYQKPFDESSEKLLKSLLEKRKQLNPSYLRVMARYVGLGLLKSQNSIH